ncbi:MAG: hypothetical protein WCK89_01035 [bacterium]
MPARENRLPFFFRCENTEPPLGEKTETVRQSVSRFHEAFHIPDLHTHCPNQHRTLASLTNMGQLAPVIDSMTQTLGPESVKAFMLWIFNAVGHEVPADAARCRGRPGALGGRTDAARLRDHGGHVGHARPDREHGE